MGLCLYILVCLREIVFENTCHWYETPRDKKFSQCDKKCHDMWPKNSSVETMPNMDGKKLSP